MITIIMIIILTTATIMTTLPAGRHSAGGPLLTHLPVSIADGFRKRAPSLSVLHLDRCIVGQK